MKGDYKAGIVPNVESFNQRGLRCGMTHGVCIGHLSIIRFS